jgi:hypothetical protein
MSLHNNKWNHGLVNLELPPIQEGFMTQPGIYYLSLTIDSSIGEEVILIIYDPTDFIHELKSVNPFRFYMSSFFVNTNFGPIFSFLFWVSQQNDENQAFCIYDKPLDISKPQSFESLNSLANQTHVHLLLVGKNYKVEGFYEFENIYSFDKALETISQMDASRVIDFKKAENEYFNEFSLDSLFKMIKGIGR